MTLTPAEHQAWSAFFVAHGLMLKRIDRALSDAGVVSLEVYDVLLHLEMSPEQRLRMSELADAVLLSRSGLTRLADRLEKEGLIERQGCPNDRRSIHIALTSKGLAERERAWPVYREAVGKDFAANLQGGEAEKVAEIFSRLCAEFGFKWLGAIKPDCAPVHD